MLKLLYQRYRYIGIIDITVDYLLTCTCPGKNTIVAGAKTVLKFANSINIYIYNYTYYISLAIDS